MKLQTLSESQVLITFVAISLLLLFSYVFGTLFEKIKGPRVVGEIIGGMILGGSCAFILFPSLMSKIFFAYPEEGQVLNIFYQLGLIFLMFLSGYNTELKINKENSKIISLVFIGATIFPMLLSIPFALVRFLLFFTVAFGLEFIGTWIPLLFVKISNTTKMNFAITMNARGGPGIVLATVTYAANIINLEFFTILILTTMLSSMIAGYYLRYQQKQNKDVFNQLT